MSDTRDQPDDVKDKFRAALERKRHQHRDAAGEGDSNGTKIHAEHAQAGAKRTFRRKSG